MGKAKLERTKHRTAVVLVSGGLDSLACLHILRTQGFDISGLHISYGQAAASMEKRAATAVSSAMKVPLQTARLSSTTKFGAGELSGRNLMLLSCGLFVTEPKPNALVLGIHQGSPYYDCSPRFVEKFREQLMDQTNGMTALVTPFLEWSKSAVIEYIKSSKLPFNLTYSCEAGKKRPCGACLSCQDRSVLIDQ